MSKSGHGFTSEHQCDLNAIADSIHYPNCWDTTCYPTLQHALEEILTSEFNCETCKEKNR